MAANQHKFTNVAKLGPNAVQAGVHIIRGSVLAERSPPKRLKHKTRKQTGMIDQVYSSHDQQRSSIAASYSQHSGQQLSQGRQQFSAIKMASALSRVHGSPVRKTDGSHSSLVNTLQ